MVKRVKQSSNSELRSSPILLNIHKYDLSSLGPAAFAHWGLDNAQPYFPPIEKLFKTADLDPLSHYGLKLNEEVSAILDPTKIRTTKGTVVETHRKTTMLLSPYKWMQGEYGRTFGLPVSQEQARITMNKIQDPNNAAYVGALLSSLLSQSGCVHFPTVYGVFSGTTAEHTIDISDDYGELSERSWFSQNIGKLFDIKLSDEIQESSEFKHTRTARLSIQLGEKVELEDISELDVTTTIHTHMADVTTILHNELEEEDDESDSSSVSTSYIFGVQSCDCGSDDEDEDEDESCEPFAWATFKKVPVQVTLMEKCEGTLYQLMILHPHTEKHLAWISQVMFALAYAQRNFGFTHNDLHANNVMYVSTTTDHYFYNCGGVLYKVPTYGYTIKVIDFERGIASVKLAGMKESKLCMSDHFCIDEEAGGQYNYGDYYLSKLPEMKPNPSFDLVRLVTSIYWDLFPEADESNLLYRLFTKWLVLDDGTSILFGKKDKNHDRFHGFNLYKAISRFCKESAIPRKEVLLLKDLYGVDSAEGNSVLMIDV